MLLFLNLFSKFILAERTNWKLLIIFFLYLIGILLLLLEWLIGLSLGKVCKLLSLIVWASSSYYLSWVINLIIILIVFVPLNSSIGLPTACFSFSQISLSSWSWKPLILVSLIPLLLLLQKHLLVLRIVKLSSVEKNLLLLVRRRIEDDLFRRNHILLRHLLLIKVLRGTILMLLIKHPLRGCWTLNELTSSNTDLLGSHLLLHGCI